VTIRSKQTKNIKKNAKTEKAKKLVPHENTNFGEAKLETLKIAFDNASNPTL
jgi:hypothetical protein